jgi:hypothetical protein
MMKFVTMCLAGFLWAGCAMAQDALPNGTRNAALRYWQAFSELKDEQTDKATRELLEKTVFGAAPWSEESLGKILDANLHAIQIMQKATTLPECDWGLEASSDEPVGFLLKARALARLNTLQGIRLAARGDSTGAVKAWLAGAKFSQDLSKGGTLIFALVARAALLSDLDALRRAGEAGSLDARSRSLALEALNSLPATGFDWGRTWETESAFISNGWQDILKSRNPKAKYKELMNEDLPDGSRLPTITELEAFRKFMGEVAKRLTLPPADARASLASLRERIKTLNPLLQSVIPSFEKVNGEREEVQIMRGKAIKALSAQ